MVTPSVTDHVFQSGGQYEPWCRFQVGRRLVQTDDRPMGATYANVPQFCNRDAEDHTMQPLNMHEHYAATSDPDQLNAPGSWLLLDASQGNVDMGSERWFTEAEATVCAWALNIIASGLHLLATDDSGVPLVTQATYQTRFYDGPTDGIAYDPTD